MDGGVSIAMMVMAATAVAAGTASAVTSAQQGKQAKYNADAAAEQAQREAKAQDAEASALNRKTIGSIAAVFGANNVDFGSGSAQKLAIDVNSRFSRARIVRLGEADRYADALRHAGKSALINGYVQAGSTLLSTASTIAGDYVSGQRKIQGGAEFSSPGPGGYPAVGTDRYNN